jgi:hypothetical protein
MICWVRAQLRPSTCGTITSPHTSLREWHCCVGALAARAGKQRAPTIPSASTRCSSPTCGCETVFAAPTQAPTICPWPSKKRWFPPCRGVSFPLCCRPHERSRPSTAGEVLLVRVPLLVPLFLLPCGRGFVRADVCAPPRCPTDTPRLTRAEDVPNIVPSCDPFEPVLPASPCDDTWHGERPITRNSGEAAVVLNTHLLGSLDAVRRLKVSRSRCHRVHARGACA